MIAVEDVGAELLERYLSPPPETVLDVGCGIQPQTLTKPRVHVCIDAHRPYLERLQAEKFDGVLIASRWNVVLPRFLDRSFDALFALDVIEHWPHEEGLKFLSQARRVAKTVLIFTPDGPFPQRYEPGEADAWGMGGGWWQTHRSAWAPEDFSGWDILELPGFHTTDACGNELPEPIGAFWSVWSTS